MVRKINEDGYVYHEPPYTEAEQMEMYRAMSLRPGATITRPNGQPAPQAAPKPQAARPAAGKRPRAPKPR